MAASFASTTTPIISQALATWIPIAVSGASLAVAVFSLWLARRSDARARRAEEFTWPRVSVETADRNRDADRALEVRVNRRHNRVYLEPVSAASDVPMKWPLVEVRNLGARPLPNLAISVELAFDSRTVGINAADGRCKTNLPVGVLAPNESVLIRIHNPTASIVTIWASPVATFNENGRYYGIACVTEDWGIDIPDATGTEEAY